MSKVTALGLDVTTQNSGHQMTGMAASVCVTPAAPSPMPIPYPTMGTVSEGITGACMRTKINGAAVLTVGSCMKSCHGNEPGTLRELVSQNTGGPCFPWLGAPNVLIEQGMAGITGSFGQMNKAPTRGAAGAASSASGAANAGTGGPAMSGAASGGRAPGGPPGGSGSGRGRSHSGAPAKPGSSSGPRDRDTCQSGHPVDVVTGHVVDQAVDLELPGIIPLVWKRYYSSARCDDREATLGPGWAHNFEQRITEGNHVFTLRDAEGRDVHFAKVEPGGATFHRRERMTLRRDDSSRFFVERIEDRLTYEFRAAKEGGPALLRAIGDAWGNTIVLEHDGSRLARIIDTAGREVRVSWWQDRIRRLEVRVDGRLEQWVDYVYSNARCLVAAVDALGFAEQYEYDKWRRMTAATIKRGARFQYEYDREGTRGRCVRTWGPEGLFAVELRIDPKEGTTVASGEEPRVYTWNDQGLATREALPDGTILEERAYDEDGYPVAEVNGAGEGRQLFYDARGNLIRDVDPAGNATAISYDARDLPVLKTGPDGLMTSYEHDARGGLSAITYPSGVTYALTRDERGRITAIHGPEGRLWTFEHDTRHNVIAETDARGARTTYTYDRMGRPVTRTDALGRTTRVSYDLLGRPVYVRYPDGTTTRLSYDEMGKPWRVVDRLQRVTEIERSGMGVVTRIRCPDGRLWRMTYTSNERVKQIENPRGETYGFTYDDAGRVIAEKTFDGRVVEYAYSKAGRVAAVRYPDKSRRAFSYDRAGRLVRDEGSDGSVITFQHDRVGRLIGAALEAQGQSVVTLLERDALGRVVTERQGDRAIRHAYDARGRRIERVMPDGARTRYAYDALDALAAVEHNGYRVNVERDVLGREQRRLAGLSGISITSTYDAMDRMVEQRATAKSPGCVVPSVLVDRQWMYDGGGRVARIEDGRWGTATYEYDRLDQLISARRGAYHEVFEYDPAGSIVKMLEGLDGRRDGGPSWEVRPGNVLTRTDKARYAYDSRGRRVRKVEPAKLSSGAEPGENRVTEYRWDCRDRLREVTLPDGTLVVMTYDAFGRRVRKEVIRPTPTGRPRIVEYLWDGEALAADIDTERGARCFVHEPGTLLPLLQEERRDVLTYVNDHLGMPKDLIDSKGLLAWSAAHSAWGKVIETHADPMSELNRRRKADTPFRLLGQVADEETGLCWTRFRCFDPEVGRWCSPDPLGVAGGYNLFGFGGSPTCVIDPLGLTTGPPHRKDKQSKRAVHSYYADGTLVLEGEQPPRLGDPIPDPEASGAHSRLRWDQENNRVYQAREFDDHGQPVRDIDFTSPAYRTGKPRSNHLPPPHQHRWVPNATGGTRSRSKRPEPL